LAGRQPATKRGSGADAHGKPAPVPESANVYTALIDGETFERKAVQYVVKDALAIVEGDVLLGHPDTVAELTKQQRELYQEPTDHEITMGVLISGRTLRWPGGRIAYEVDPELPNRAQIDEAIDHWTAQTLYSFTLRTTADAAQWPDYIAFQLADLTCSHVGRQGGRQVINLAPDFTLGDVIHQIGHAVGLWHEHSRTDRDGFVTIRWDKIQPGMEHNFNQYITDGDDVGAYDYGSVMHYPQDAFSSDGSETITPVDSSARIGQRSALSAGDVAAANSFLEVSRTAESGATPDFSAPSGAPPGMQAAFGAPSIDPQFWFDRSRLWVESAIGAHDSAAEALQLTLAWFWTVYSTAAVVGVALADRDYAAWAVIIIALPSPLLIFTYLVAAYVRLPRVVEFDATDVGDIKRQYETGLRAKQRRLKIVVALCSVSAVAVAGAVVAAATSSPAA
jgi:Astacin (Peptidase family M12A)